MVTTVSVVLGLELVTDRVLRIVVAWLVSFDDSVDHCMAPLWAVCYLICTTITRCLTHSLLLISLCVSWLIIVYYSSARCVYTRLPAHDCAINNVWVPLSVVKSTYVRQ